MTRWHAILLVSLIAVSLAGCSSKAALPAKKVPPLAGPARTAPSRQPERAAKPVARESSFSTYANPDYGVTFRYPRNFALVERAALAEQDASEDGAPLDASGARSQEELEQEEPGAVLVATVVVPDDAYPNTTFAGGSLQFAVNRYQTAGSCRRELVSRLGDSNGRNGALTIQGVEFAWVDSDEGDGSTEFFERDYAGFANGTCYQFFLRVGVATAEDSDGPRPPDERKILGHMEKIVSSLQLESQSVSVLDGPTTGEIKRRTR